MITRKLALVAIREHAPFVNGKLFGDENMIDDGVVLQVRAKVVERSCGNVRLFGQFIRV